MAENEEVNVESTEDGEDVSQEEQSNGDEKQISSQDIERMEEEKLKAKYPIGMRPVSGQSAFLQKRLANRQKYFDSGDYQMAKQQQKGGPAAKARQLPAGLAYVTGDAIPTPETVPVRKTSIIQPTKFMGSTT